VEFELLVIISYKRQLWDCRFGGGKKG